MQDAAKLDRLSLLLLSQQWPGHPWSCCCSTHLRGFLLLGHHSCVPLAHGSVKLLLGGLLLLNLSADDAVTDGGSEAVDSSPGGQGELELHTDILISNEGKGFDGVRNGGVAVHLRCGAATRA